MPVPHHPSGIAYPDDLKFLKEIYDAVCFERGFHCGSPAAADLARATMDLFAQGVIEEAEIRECLDAYLGRKSTAGELLRTEAQS
jgi:hypothetical protein